MTKPKHTPGPWDNKGTHKAPVDFGVFDTGGRAICSTGGYCDGKETTYFENMANAHLIAAAPELLALVKEVAENEYHGFYRTAVEGGLSSVDFREWQAKAVNIIAKAENRA